MWSFVRVRSMRCATSIAIALEVGKSVRRDLEEHASSSIFYVMVGARSRATGSRTWLDVYRRSRADAGVKAGTITFQR